MREIPYDRAAAVAYARRWALGRNPAFYDFENLGGEKIKEILNEVSLEGSYADAINNKIREL